MARRQSEWEKQLALEETAVQREWERQVRRWQARERAMDAVYEALPKAVAVLVNTLEHGEPREQLAVATLLLRWREQHGQQRPTLLLSLESERRNLAAIALTAGERGNLEEGSEAG
ncbi:MAG: hypothetical protein KatS3mg061_1870 [Dehalococcoidia bacterium]|nr:MAG: hypothetical protein KatS3mg061_1870 [Dehalococcoidia bacterium]